MDKDPIYHDLKSISDALEKAAESKDIQPIYDVFDIKPIVPPMEIQRTPIPGPSIMMARSSLNYYTYMDIAPLEYGASEMTTNTYPEKYTGIKRLDKEQLIDYAKMHDSLEKASVYESTMESFDVPLTREEQIRQIVASGNMPNLDNGFSFVTDQRPDNGQNKPIPPAEYTAYFSQRQIPVAPKDHMYHRHDVSHMPSYQDMFAHKDFADLVTTAASNSLASPELTSRFTGAIDRFGDYMSNISRSDSYVYYDFLSYSIKGARLNLSELVALRFGIEQDAELSDEAQELMDDLWHQLGLDAQEFTAKLIEKSEAAKVEEMRTGIAKPRMINSKKVLQDDILTMHKKQYTTTRKYVYPEIEKFIPHEKDSIFPQPESND